MMRDFQQRYAKGIKKSNKVFNYSLKLSNFLLCNINLLADFNWNERRTRHKIPVKKLRYKFWCYCDLILPPRTEFAKLFLAKFQKQPSVL